MKLATIRTDGRTACVRIDNDQAVETGHADLGSLLCEPNWRDLGERADGRVHLAADLDFAPVVPRPGKILCVGLNYRSHILEMGMDLPEYPTLFTKFPDALIGADDDIILPVASDAVDWEAELAVIIGAAVRHADRHVATDAIAGYTLLNDVSVRDWQFRTTQWDQGKSFEGTTPFGPVMLTADSPPDSMTITCEVDGEVVQQAAVSDLVFDAPSLVSYASTIMTLHPGDVISTGTPAGVGHGCSPPRYLATGQTLVTRIAQIGTCSNNARREASPVGAAAATRFG